MTFLEEINPKEVPLKKNLVRKLIRLANMIDLLFQNLKCYQEYNNAISGTVEC